MVLAKVGFDTEELELGWSEWDVAVGRKIPFSVHLAAQRRSSLVGISAAQRSRIAVIDAFENTWFVRCRNAIRRFVTESELEAFEAAFFQDLEQQPEGPGVVGSVDTLLDRIHSMSTSDVAGAADAFAALEKKGLTDPIRAPMRQLVDEARRDFDPSAAPAVEQEELVALADERRVAYRRLNAWYIDWADAVRTQLSYHQAVRLGVTASKGGRKTVLDEAEVPLADLIEPVEG